MFPGQGETGLAVIKIPVTFAAGRAEGFVKGRFNGLAGSVIHTCHGMAFTASDIFMKFQQRKVGALMIETFGGCKGSKTMTLPAIACQLPLVIIAMTTAALDGNRLVKDRFTLAGREGHPGSYPAGEKQYRSGD
jgi:hypothetical protein